MSYTDSMLIESVWPNFAAMVVLRFWFNLYIILHSFLLILRSYSKKKIALLHTITYSFLMSIKVSFPSCFLCWITDFIVYKLFNVLLCGLASACASVKLDVWWVCLQLFSKIVCWCYCIMMFLFCSSPFLCLSTLISSIGPEYPLNQISFF